MQNTTNKPNTYTQIYIHTVFAVQNRLTLIQDTWKDRLYLYISAIIQNYNHKVLAISGMPNHIHILFEMHQTQSLSELMKKVKGDSSRWINENHYFRERFSWQQGYGAFSYSKSQIPNVINYIHNQKQYHSKESFIDEYKKLLKIFCVNYDERYIFKPIE